MNQALQGTLKQPLSFQGKGLHTGKHSQITIHPADADMGIVFRRTDRAGKNTQIQAHWKNVKQLPLCTCISSPNKVHIRTIEHLMAAFYACGIDNALIDVKGSEIPILDGSASEFVAGIKQVGIKYQEATRRIFRITKKLEIKEKNREIIVEPADTLNINITVLISDIGARHWSGNVSPERFANEISPARTFGHLKDGLLAQLTRFTRTPICLGANTNTAVVIGKDGKILNKEGLRNPDEMVNHRLLDLVGDLMLVGGHVQGKITSLGPVHRLTHQLLKKAFDEQAIVEG